MKVQNLQSKINLLTGLLFQMHSKHFTTFIFLYCLRYFFQLCLWSTYKIISGGHMFGKNVSLLLAKAVEYKIVTLF